MRFFSRFLRALVVPALAVLAGCGGSAGAARQPVLGATPGSVRHAEGIAFERVAADHDSGIRLAHHVVIRDEQALRELWQAHNRGRAVAAVEPGVDFTRKMVVGVFLGEQAQGCVSANIARASMEGGRLRIAYETRTRTGPCTDTHSTPAAFAAVERSDAHADFVRIYPQPLALEPVHSATQSGVQVAKLAIARDEAQWKALWEEHRPQEPRPYIDFSRHMVVASFLGQEPNGCYAIALHGAYREGGKVTVRRTLTLPGPGTACTMAITSPAYIARIDRTDGEIEFATETVTL